MGRRHSQGHTLLGVMCAWGLSVAEGCGAGFFPFYVSTRWNNYLHLIPVVELRSEFTDVVLRVCITWQALLRPTLAGLCRAARALGHGAATTSQLAWAHLLRPVLSGLYHAARALGRGATTTSQLAWARLLRPLLLAARSAATLAARAAAPRLASACRLGARGVCLGARVLLPLGWPLGGCATTGVLVCAAVDGRALMPFGVAAYCSGIVTLLMVAKAAQVGGTGGYGSVTLLVWEKEQSRVSR